MKLTEQKTINEKLSGKQYNNQKWNSKSKKHLVKKHDSNLNIQSKQSQKWCNKQIAESEKTSKLKIKNGQTYTHQKTSMSVNREMNKVQKRINRTSNKA